jgi:hypothetical protein
MAIHMGTTLRNSRLDAISTAATTTPAFSAFSGAQGANCAAANPSGLLVTINMPNPSWSAASGGTKAKTGTWSGTASGTGTPASARVYSSQGTLDGTTCILDVDAAVGSGTVNFNGTITSGQTVTVTTFDFTEGNA